MSNWPELKPDFTGFHLHTEVANWRECARLARDAMPPYVSHAAVWVEWAYTNVDIALQVAALFGLRVSNQTRTVMVGPGYGTELRILLDRGVPAIGVDPDRTAVESAISLGIVPKDNYVCSTAQDYLSALEPQSINFVVGCNLAPSFSQDTQAVYDAAYHALDKRGVLVLCGDGYYLPHRGITGFEMHPLDPCDQFTFAARKRY